MRLRLIIVALCCVALTSCNTKRVIYITIGGSSSTDIHDVVKECAEGYGLPLIEDENWKEDEGDGLSGNYDARRVRNKINDLVSRNGGDKSNLSLLVVGKSAGGVLAWNTFKRHYSDIDDFHRIALVLVDPHGAVRDDERGGPYTDHRNLWWPDDWSEDQDALRVYHIYQHEDWPYGADFPDSRVFESVQLSGSGIDHDEITGHSRTRELITEAMEFTFVGR